MSDTDYENDTHLFPEWDEQASSKKRDTCLNCYRPKVVCWCDYLPSERISVGTRITIIQHPAETSKPLKTAPMVANMLENDNCLIVAGKHLYPHRNPKLFDRLSHKNTVLLYPNPNAVNICDLPPEQSYHLVLLDGTWSQANLLYKANKFLHSLPKVKISPESSSRFIVKTQPREYCLSTVEACAISLSLLEKRPELFQVMVRPLEAMCRFQLQFGAVRHSPRRTGATCS